MQPIPRPHVLDPDRILDNERDDFTLDHEKRADLLADGLRKTSDYGQQLWNTLAATREYLADSLPSDPRSPGPHPSLSASPTGPDDGEGWDKWIDAYASVTSALCGPHGDSGFGAGEARKAARARRTAPNIAVVVQAHGEPHQSTATAEAGTPAAAVSAGADRSTRFLRSAGLVALVFLAVRGLRPGRARALI